MQKAHYIKKAAIKYIEQNSVWFKDFTNWYVGITADPDQRHAAHGRPSIWRAWATNHPSHARELEKLFLQMGFKGAPGGGTRTYYIYIYKHSGPLT